MYIWQECEDYRSSNGNIEIIDDWGAAAMRCVRLRPSSGMSYSLHPGPGAQWYISIRYRATARGAGLMMTCQGQENRIWLEPAESEKSWRWHVIPAAEFGPLAPSQDRQVGVSFVLLEGQCDLDGFFFHSEQIELPKRVDELDARAGEREACGVGYQGDLAADMRGCIQPEIKLGSRFPSDIAKEAAKDTWPVLKALAAKPCPYIVKTYDTRPGTDYNSDYSWHALDKEKRWELPASGMLGLVNPNSDVYYALGFGMDERNVTFRPIFRPVLHIADMLIYEVDLHPDLRCEVMLRCATSNSVAITVHLANRGDTERRVTVADVFGKDPQDNPPFQRYVLPNQKFGTGVTTTTGGMIWRGWLKGADAACICFAEWVRSRCRGRRLLLTTRSIVPDDARTFEPEADISAPDAPGALMEGALHLIVPARGSASAAIVFNMRRFTTGDDWNPEVTPALYRKETEQEAVEAGYASCVEALSEDLEQSIRRSVRSYAAYPIIDLPEKSWETDFHACLELPRASTFTPLGNLQTPFYNFCRVHAHEPFGWWSYGMHAHESLCTLFTNITEPHLSAEFLRGHIHHQREDGKYPYGVSHTINPRLTTQEATAPLIVWEAWNSYLWSGDVEFLREAYESGKRSHEWWLRERDRCGEGLCHWLNTCNESVRDDHNLPTWQVTGGSQHQETLDLNCYLLVQERTLAMMASELGIDQDYEHYYYKSIYRARLMNACMWHEEDRCYYGIGEVVPSWADVRDISTFFPLWARLAPKGRFEAIAELVNDPKTFGLPYGPPSLAANEPTFGPEKHWHGSNWVEMSLFAILGLKYYGYYSRAAQLAYRNTRMVFDELEKFGHFREYFNSLTGEGVDLIDYIWTAMPAYFIVNIFLGLEPNIEHLEVMPALPEGWSQASIENIRVRGRRISVSVQRDDKIQLTQAKVSGKPVDVVGNRGVRIPWPDFIDGAYIEIVQPVSIQDHPAPPPEAPEHWDDIPAHEYPDDQELARQVESLMKNKENMV